MPPAHSQVPIPHRCVTNRAPRLVALPHDNHLGCKISRRCLAEWTLDRPSMNRQSSGRDSNSPQPILLRQTKQVTLRGVLFGKLVNTWSLRKGARIPSRRFTFVETPPLFALSVHTWFARSAHLGTASAMCWIHIRVDASPITVRQSP